MSVLVSDLSSPSSVGFCPLSSQSTSMALSVHQLCNCEQLPVQNYLHDYTSSSIYRWDSNPSVPISFKLPTAVKLCLISMFTWVYVCEKLSYVTYQIWLIWFGLRLNPLFIPSFPPPLPRLLSPSFLSDRASLWSSCVVLPLLALTWMSAVLAITDRRSTLFQVMCLTTPMHARHSSVALRHHG